MTEPTKAVVAFDLRRNLINVLGEDHYPYAEFLYHELAANAYDADATEVEIIEETVTPAGPGRPPVYNITIRDDGIGMDEDALAEWFRLGESSKPQRKISELFGRPLIGQIGVGKVAILKAAREWVITTEKTRGIESPKRLRVDVNVDDWISGRTESFEIQELEPTGRHGTELLLAGVTTRMRTDRIVRHLQRLPLFKDDFKVRRNGEIIRPREWWGDSRRAIDITVEWHEGGETRTGRVFGEIWVRPPSRSRSETPFIEEPSDERDGLKREAAGIDVRVNGDTVAREFFDHDTHGHGINRIWGWVEADFLPILGNRTDYQRDHPASVAFREAVKPIFFEVYNPIRVASNRSRTRGKQSSADAKTGTSATASNEDVTATPGAPEVGDTDDAPTSDEPDRAPEVTDPLAAKFGDALYEVIDAHPELAPIVNTEARPRAGRPAKDRVYPARRSGSRGTFLEDVDGTERAMLSSREVTSVDRVTVGTFTNDDSGEEVDAVDDVERLDVAASTPAGIRLRFVALSPLEAPYVWNLTNPTELSLDINTEHALYRASSGAGQTTQRMLCAWLISMALAEQRRPRLGRVFAEEVETLCYDLFERSGERRT